MFKLYFKKRREKAEAEAYRRGYDYAAGALLRGDGSPEYYEQLAQTGETFGEGGTHKCFDRGIRGAIDKLVELGVIVDDRVYGY